MSSSRLKNASIIVTVDVEEWFHVLDSPVVPPMERWDSLPSRVEFGLERILDTLEACGVCATMFCLGWVAERHSNLVRKCARRGHEIASHGYGHVLAYKVGPKAFLTDIARAKSVLEDITGAPVVGFRAPGFGITGRSRWAFDVIRSAGYLYDASIFPARRAHGGIPGERVGPHLIKTAHGILTEFPTSILNYAGFPLSLFGGGYLRATPRPVLLWAAERLLSRGRSVILYVHPREFDPDHPRLPLPWLRYAKCYMNLPSTEPKIRNLLRLGHCITMHDACRSEFADSLEVGIPGL